MKSRYIHIVLCLVLALLYVVERQLPCVDDCESASNESSVVAGAEQHEADNSHGAKPPATNHCDHCSCPCHVPGLQSVPVIGNAVEVADISFPTLSISIPTPPVGVPDHIPLV